MDLKVELNLDKQIKERQDYNEDLFAKGRKRKSRIIPVRFKITSAPCTSSLPETTFDVESEDTPQIKRLIYHGNPQIELGDEITVGIEKRVSSEFKKDISRGPICQNWNYSKELLEKLLSSDIAYSQVNYNGIITWYTSLEREFEERMRARYIEKMKDGRVVRAWRKDI